jgi:hypothetical protein
MLTLVFLLIFYGSQRWHCGVQPIGKNALTKVDTYNHFNRDDRRQIHFVGGGVEVGVQIRCFKGSREMYFVTGSSDWGPFSGWVDANDLIFERPLA